MALKISVPEKVRTNKKVKLLGIGDSGIMRLNRLFPVFSAEVEFIAVNDDEDSLKNSKAHSKIYVEKQGGIGKEHQVIREHLEDADILFVTAGLGRGMGTKGMSAVAEMGAETNCLCIGMVTLPFLREGKQNYKDAERILQKLSGKLDMVVTVPLDGFPVDAGMPIKGIVDSVTHVLEKAINSILYLMNVKDLFSLNHKKVKEILKKKGQGWISYGTASGKRRAEQAALEAMKIPYLKKEALQKAKCLTVHISGDEQITLHEVDEVFQALDMLIDDKTEISFGLSCNNGAGLIRVTLIGTGLNGLALSESENSLNQEHLKNNLIYLHKEDYQVPAYLRKVL